MARVDAQLLSQELPGPLVGLQRLGLAPRAIQTQQQLPVQPLLQRVLSDQRLQLGDQLGVAAEGQVGLDPDLQDGQVPLGEPGALGLGERLVGELRQRPATPQPERLAQPGRCQLRHPAERLGALVGEPLEAGQVQLVGVQLQQVAGLAAGQDGGRLALRPVRSVF